VGNQRVRALSISRPVLDILKRDGLAAQVLASYRHACNLVTSQGEIFALVSPAIGNGPLNIVIEEAGALKHMKPGLPAAFSDEQLVLGDSLVVLLEGARLWEPRVNWERLITRRRRLEDSLATLCGWLSQNDAKGLLGLILGGEKDPGAREDGICCLAFLTVVRVAIGELLQALQDGDRMGIRENAALLAGLGPGSTPAGDDYLVGLMAGLRVWSGLLNNSGLSPQEACQIILEATEGRTTLLSSAFLRCAKEGLFGENWHRLLAELARGEAMGIQQAARRILSSGATSGADALAGFLSPYLFTQSSKSPLLHRGEGREQLFLYLPVALKSGKIKYHWYEEVALQNTVAQRLDGVPSQKRGKKRWCFVRRRQSRLTKRSFRSLFGK